MRTVVMTSLIRHNLDIRALLARVSILELTRRRRRKVDFRVSSKYLNLKGKR